MTKEEFIELYDQWSLENSEELLNKQEKAKEEMRKFLALFGTLKQLEDMELLDYAFQTKGSKRSLCYLIDFGTDSLGINRCPYQSGHQRYGIQLQENGVDWYPFSKQKNNKSKYGNNPEEVFDHFKSEIITLFKATKNDENLVIDAIDMPQPHLNKLHYIFSNGNSVPIYARSDLDRLLDLFVLGKNKNESTFIKRIKVYDFIKSLNRDDITPLNFMIFAYSDYGKKHILKKINNEITLEVFRGQVRCHELNLFTNVQDYSNDEELVNIGNACQNIVYEYLINHRKKLKIKRNTEIIKVYENPISGIHCDFLYIRKDGNVEKEIYIECKATKSNIPNGFRFKMSALEKEFMDKNKETYSIYYINDVYHKKHIIEIKPDDIKKMIKPSEYIAKCEKI